MPPVPIEEAVKRELPIVSYAMLIGDQRKFLSMLLTLKVRLGLWPHRTPRAARVHLRLGTSLWKSRSAWPAVGGPSCPRQSAQSRWPLPQADTGPPGGGHDWTAVPVLGDSVTGAR